MRTTIVVNVYRDEHLALRLLRQIRYHYGPVPKVVVIFDGPPLGTPTWLFADVIQIGSRLKHVQSGLWSERYLKTALMTEPDLIVKLDPDASVNSNRPWPNLDWAGTISKSPYRDEFVRGGACLFSATAARALVASGLLQHPSPHSYRRYQEFRWPHEEESAEWISCQDRIVGDAMRALGYPPQLWAGINVLGNALVSPSFTSGSITHPHPMIL